MKVTLRIIPYLLLQIFIVALIGINDLYQANWNPGRLSDLGFWLDYLTITLATIISFFSWANIKIDIFLGVKYEKGMDESSQLGEMVASKRNTLNGLIVKEKEPSIKYCIDEINAEEKEHRFNYKYTNKLNKAKYGFLGRIFKKHYQAKAEQYEEMLTVKWQAKNLKDFRVRYVAINESYIVNGVNIKNPSNFRKRSDSRNVRLVKDNYHKWLLSLAYMMFFTSMGFQLMEGITPVIIFTIGIRVMNCVMQSVMGIRYASVYVSTKVIPELDDRQSIMEYYIKGKTVYNLMYKQEQDAKLQKLKEVEEDGRQQMENQIV